MKEARAATTPERTQARFGSRRADLVDLLQRGVGTVSKLSTRLGVLRRTRSVCAPSGFAAIRIGDRAGSEPGTRRPAQGLSTQLACAGVSGPGIRRLPDRAPHRQETAFARGKLLGLLRSWGGGIGRADLKRVVEKSLLLQSTNAVHNPERVGRTARRGKGGGLVWLAARCPLAAIVAEHPDTCFMVQTFLSRVIRAPVRESCLRGLKAQCQFAIGFAW